MARWLGDIDAAGENADGGFVYGEGTLVGGNIDTKCSAADDGATSEGHVLGEFLGDGFALGGGSTGAHDADFRLVEAVDVATNEEGSGGIGDLLECFGVVVGLEDCDSGIERGFNLAGLWGVNAISFDVGEFGPGEEDFRRIRIGRPKSSEELFGLFGIERSGEKDLPKSLGVHGVRFCRLG